MIDITDPRYFERQDYPERELVIVDDGDDEFHLTLTFHYDGSKQVDGTIWNPNEEREATVKGRCK